MVGGQIGRSTVRACKNVTKGYSPTQKKVRSSTNNDPEPPTTRDMNEIANMSYNNIDFIEIMEVLDKRLNDRGKNWRHVFKALTVLEYLLLYGSENVFKYCEDNLYEIKTLREFQHIDDNGMDQGMNIRQVAKDITNLVLNPQTLRQRRRRGGASDYDPRASSNNSARPRSGDEERRDARKPSQEEQDLQRAIELSKAEEEKRMAAVAKANSSVFNDLEQAKKDDPLIDLSDISISPSAPLQVQYTVQPQYTAVQPQFTQLGVQPQYTQFQPQYTFGNPYDAQRQQEAMQAEYLRQQAEWTAQQQEAQRQQQLMAQQQALQAQQAEEMLRQQQMLQYQQTSLSVSPQQPMLAQPTGISIGSNNPFGPGGTPGPSPSPSLTVSSATTRSSMGSPSTPYSARSLSRATNISSVSADDRHAALAGLYAARTGAGDDGVDTFGNTGLLRYGPTDTGRIAVQKTGGAGYVFSQPTAASVY